MNTSADDTLGAGKSTNFNRQSTINSGRSSDQTTSSPIREDEDDDDDQPPKIPYRRERTPSIIVQSLGLSFNKDSSINESIELPGDEAGAHQENEDLSPNSESSDPKSSTSGIDEHPGVGDSSGGSAKGSQSSLQTSSAGISSPIRGSRVGGAKSAVSPPNLAGGNRRLSLNIGSIAPRRQSLTVDGLNSASFINPGFKEVSYPGGSATGSLRNKVALKPGHSLMGWIKLASTAKDLSGTNGKIIEVTPEELANHDKESDCWVALKGNVYNVTTYLQYHPGGVEELMRGAGRDATELFNEVHRWVNYESILAKCLVGPYKLESPLTPAGRSSFTNLSSIQHQSTGGPSPTTASKASLPGVRDPTVAHRPSRRQSIALTVPSPNKYQSLLLNNNSSTNINQIHHPPTYVIMQDKTGVKLKIQDLATALPCIRSRNLICDLIDRAELHVSVILSPDWLYRIHLKLHQQVMNSLTATLSNEDGIITVQMSKSESGIWNKIGTALDLNDSLCEMTLADKYFRPCRLTNRTQLTHDTHLFEFDFSNSLMYIPIGWHVLVREHQEKGQAESSEQNENQDLYRIHKNYTPVLPTIYGNDGLTDETGFMNKLYFIIKIYTQGAVTSHLDRLRIGDRVDISDYQIVDFDIETLVNKVKHWFLFAAGTGITPFCRIISYLLSKDEDIVLSVTLVFFNKTQNDIIIRDQLYKLEAKYSGRFKVIHVLSAEQEKTSNWSGIRGKINRELVASLVDTKSPDDIQLLACGPRPFTQLTKSIVTELSLNERLYIFHG